MVQVDVETLPKTNPPKPAVFRRRPPSLIAMAEKAIQTRLQALLKNEPGTRAGEDWEALHDMRVASRRLREALSVYMDLFPRKKLKKAAADVRQITRALGMVREVDVNLIQLQAWKERLGDRCAMGIEMAMAMEYQRQRRLRVKMVERLDKVDLAELQEDTDRMLERRTENPRTVEAAPAPNISFASFARQHIFRGVESVQSARAMISAHPTLRNLHQLRIRLKRFRYMVELLSRTFESHRAKRILRQLKLLQDELGTLHDRDVLRATIRSLRAHLRSHQLSLLDTELHRFLLLLAREQFGHMASIQEQLAQLDRRRFFEKIPGSMRD